MIRAMSIDTALFLLMLQCFNIWYCCHKLLMRECENARMRECENARMRECENARMRECENARMREHEKLVSVA